MTLCSFDLELILVDSEYLLNGFTTTWTSRWVAESHNRMGKL